MKLGVNTVLFGSHPLAVALQQIKRAGYEAAEISALDGVGAFGNPLGEHLHLDNWRADVSHIRALSRDLDLPLSAMEVGPLDEERILHAIEAAAELGIPVINVGPSGRSGMPADLQACIDRLAALTETAADAGITLCVKAHIGTAMDSTKTTLDVLRQISSPAFGIDMDPSHIFRAGEDPAAALQQVIRRVKHVHIRDSGPGPAPGPAEMQACGRADVDLYAYCQVLVDAGYNGPVNLEIIGASDYPVSRSAMIAAESFGYLNAVLRACNPAHTQA